jgi:hypothetical protein
VSLPDIGTLTEALKARGVIAADAAQPPMDAMHRPWFVTLLLGFAGWLAGIFLLVFIGMLLDLDSRTGILIVGLVLLAGAWGLYHADRQAAFLDQLALALSIAGQCAVAWGLLEDVRSAVLIAGTLLLMQLAVLFIMPNKTARTIAALFAAIAWVYTIRFVLRHGDEEDLIFHADMDHARFGVAHFVFGWLLTWAPLVALARWLTLHEPRWMADPLRIYARPVLTGAILGLSLGGIATEPFMTIAIGFDRVGIDMSWLALFPLLSIVLAMFAAWCAFQVRNHGLLGFAALASLLHLSRFYYFYGTSLTWKSLIMLCAGVLMLGAGVLLQKRAAQSGAAP